MGKALGGKPFYLDFVLSSFPFLLVLFNEINPSLTCFRGPAITKHQKHHGQNKESTFHLRLMP